MPYFNIFVLLFYYVQMLQEKKKKDEQNEPHDLLHLIKIIIIIDYRVSRFLFYIFLVTRSTAIYVSYGTQFIHQPSSIITPLLPHPQQTQTYTFVDCRN